MRISGLVQCGVRIRIRQVLFCLTIIAVASMTSWAQSSKKKIVAVFDFTNAAVQGGIDSSSLQTSTADLGKGVSELLISKLVQDGTVSVVERSAIDKVLAEQNLSNSDRADPATAAKLGRLLGADGVVLGTITRYDYDEKMKGYVGGGRARRSAPSPKAKYDIAAKVQISTRLISPNTAEVLAVSEGVGETNRKNVLMDVRDTSGRVMQAVGENSPVVNESMDKAIAQLAERLEPEVAKLPPHVPLIDGLVAGTSESGQLVLNVGERDGLKVGDRLQVLRAGKEILDPATGKVLMRNDTVLGEAVITKVTDISAIADYHGGEPAKVRDVVKSIPTKP